MDVLTEYRAIDSALFEMRNKQREKSISDAYDALNEILLKDGIDIEKDGMSIDETVALRDLLISKYSGVKYEMNPKQRERALLIMDILKSWIEE